MLLHQLADLRKEYLLKKFNEEDVNQDPITQFKIWFNEAMKAELPEPNAMTLATVNENGFPSARIVLLKGIEDDAFVFYTNYHSNKGKHISHNNHVALVFCWLELQRQVRIEGVARKMDESISDAYFLSRPIGSQIGAYASEQSKQLSGREELENAYKHFEALFAKQPIVRPVNWGGYNVVPHKIEFWQGRENRLHDRILYVHKELKGWEICRLAP
jgi:pyridoxamine 5'-phosphate oxidase